MVRRRTRNPPWADLPQELLSAIANFLTSDSTDTRNFRAVCKSWYSSSPPPPLILSPLLPLAVRCPQYCFDGRFGCKLGKPFISATAVFTVSNPEAQYSKSWLLFADQLNPGKIMIRQPFTKKSYQMPVNFPRFLDLPNIRVDEVARFYNLSFRPNKVITPPSIWSEYVRKVVLSSDESIVVALFLTGQVGYTKLRKFPLWKLGWIFAHYSNVEDKFVDDVVNYNGNIVGVDRVGRVYDYSNSDPKLKVTVTSIVELGTKRKRLVESNGELYLVVRGSFSERSNDSDKFTVLKLHKKLSRWVRVNSIGGRIFFFGLDFSFSVTPQELDGSIGANCIVYKEGSFRDYGGGVDDDIMLSSNLRSGDLEIGVWHMDDPCHIDVIGAYHGYSDVIWPPPAWLWPSDRSKHLGDLEAAHDGLPKASIPGQNSKTMSKEPSPLEQIPTAPTGDSTSHRDASKICKVADTVKEYLNKVGDIYKDIESYKAHSLSRQQHSNAINLQDEEGLSISEAEERQASVSLFHSASEHSNTNDCCKRNLNDLLLNLEECTSKLQNTLKSYQHEAVVDRPVTKPPVLITYTRKRRKGNTSNN